MRREPDGLHSGGIAEAVGCPHNTLSTHLSILARSGLVGTRDGRSIVYRADVAGMRALITFLIEDCCDGHPEVCNLAGLLREANCCSPPPKRNQGNKQRRT
jgi:ArsR family transcriptional regulator, arsenate/arsenite/antimonite-responsive transcriptional repressor